MMKSDPVSEKPVIPADSDGKSPTHTVLVRTVSLTVALILSLCLLFAAERVLVPKYLTVSPEGSLTEEYYAAADEVHHDLLFIGDCEVYEAFIPAVLFEEYGISSYVRGGAQQLVWHSYYLLEDALRYETPEAVVFNVLSLKYGEPQKEAYNRLNLDGMACSTLKWQAVRDSLTDGESIASYVFPLLRYHSRFDELTREDFTYAFRPRPLVSDSGYLMQTAVVPADPAQEQPVSPLVDPALPARAMDYLDRMVALCREKGIRLILVKSPTDSWHYHFYDEWDAQIRDYAGEHDLPYYNLIPEAGNMGLDMTRDSYDGGVHLNVYGAEKLTRYFGRILSQDQHLPDRRGDPAFRDVWGKRCRRFHDRKTAMEASAPAVESP